MPLDFDQGLIQIRQSRQSRRQQEGRLVENRNELSRRQAVLSALVRAGASAAEISTAEDSVADAQAERRSLLDAVADTDISISEIVGELIAGVPEADLFKQLDGTVPIALLPVRLETRFFLDGTDNQLRIRIYPDQVHIDNHPRELLPQERELGMKYWRIHRQGDPEKLRAAWIRLGQQFTPTRAAWIVQALTPTDLDSGDSEPDFPDVAEREDGTIHVPRARLLPERWVALGFEHDLLSSSYIPLFTKWGDTVPDSLSVGLSFDELSEPVEVEDEDPSDGEDAEEDALPINPEVLWTVDYEEAHRVGMAITVVEDADLPQGKNLQDGVDLLVVLGVDWTFAPAEGADNIAGLFVAHQYSDGMAFVPQGTPTNNTGPSRSGFTTDPVALASEMDPAAQPTPTSEDHAAQRMAGGLGLASQEMLIRVPNSGLHEQAIASTMVDALWEGTLGHYLDELMDPLASDAFIDLARDHAARFLQPFGPYAALRVGKQPYGLLPVLSLDRFEPDRGDGVEETLSNLLRALIGFWQSGLDKVHFMGKNDDPDTDLLALLQQNPLSVAKRFRLVLDSETTTNTKGGVAYAKIHADLRRALSFQPLASTIDSRIAATKLAQMDPQPTDHPLFGPWVQAGDLETDGPLEPNYIQELIADVRGGAEGRKRLHDRTKSRILLEALLAYAALRELDRAGSKVLDQHLVDNTDQLQALPPKSTLTTRSLTGIYTAADALQADQVLIETPEQQASLVVPDLTKGLPLSEFLSQEVSDDQQPETPASLRNLKTFLASLEQLATYPAREIDRIFRAVLDAYSYRLDAWLTSLASRRLQRVRESSPVGLHVGGYGWVENLRPDIGQGDSLGYIHTPSIAHASAAAIMRSGHLSHRGPQNSGSTVAPGSAESVLSIDLSSERVRQALTLLDGVAQDQSLAELLGYRFERQLRDRDPLLMKFVRPLRKIAPLRSTVPGTSSVSAEDIAVRDVVDGIKLLEEWRKDDDELLSRIQDPAPDSNERNKLEEELARLDEMFDAVSDLLVAEGVYQTVRGNYERAGAALSALDRQSQPPEPQFVRTPRSGMVYQQRVLVLVQDDSLPVPWDDLPRDLRAELEPRLNAWIANLLGDPGRFELVAQVREGDVVQETVPAPLSDFVIETELSPLSLVLMSATAGSRGPSELELNLARFFAGRVDNPAEGMTLELLNEPISADQDDTAGFGALQALLQMIHSVVFRPRSADASDLTPAGSDEDPASVLQNLVDQVQDLETRLSLASSALETAIEHLGNAIDGSPPQPQSLRKALRQAFHLALPDAYPAAVESDPSATQVLLPQARTAFDALQRKQAELEAKEKNFQKELARLEEASELSEVRRLTLTSDHLVEQIRTMMGESFPVLPTFSLSNAQELAASRSDRNALIDDELAPVTWLQQVAMVRPQIQELVSALTAGEMLGTPISPTEFQIMQLPHRPGQTWAALTAPDPDNEPSLALLAIGQFDLGQPLAGIVCDGWTEVIPAHEEMTGLSFHYDAPAARAPQSIVLAVPPSLEQESWDFESVRDSVLFTLELAKLRAVGPKELTELGSLVLPMLYIPQDRTKQRPSIDLGGITERWKAKVGETLGKMNSHDF